MDLSFVSTTNLNKSLFWKIIYLVEPNVAKRKEFTKQSAHRLRIETDRYCRPKILAELRICKLCESADVEDEQHFVCHCKCFDNELAISYQELSQYLILYIDEHDQFVSYETATRLY
jgi:hypothetical protein